MANKKSTQKQPIKIVKNPVVLRYEKNIAAIEKLIANGHNTPENNIRLNNLKKELEGISK